MKWAAWWCLATLGLVTASGQGWAQTDPGPDPDIPKHRFIEPRVLPAPSPIYPLSAGSGIESDLQVGDAAPPFEMQDASGAWVRLADMRGQWALMVFAGNRKVLVPLQGVADSLRTLGTRVYGVSVDATSSLKAFASREGISFALLSDPTSQVSQLFGMYSEEDDTPETGVVLIDPWGVVRLMRLDDSPQPEEVLRTARWAEGEAAGPPRAEGAMGRR